MSRVVRSDPLRFSDSDDDDKPIAKAVVSSGAASTGNPNPKAKLFDDLDDDQVFSLPVPKPSPSPAAASPAYITTSFNTANATKKSTKLFDDDDDDRISSISPTKPPPPSVLAPSVPTTVRSDRNKDNAIKSTPSISKSSSMFDDDDGSIEGDGGGGGAAISSSNSVVSVSSSRQKSGVIPPAMDDQDDDGVFASFSWSRSDLLKGSPQPHGSIDSRQIDQDTAAAAEALAIAELAEADETRRRREQLASDEALARKLQAEEQQHLRNPRSIQSKSTHPESAKKDVVKQLGGNDIADLSSELLLPDDDAVIPIKKMQHTTPLNHHAPHSIFNDDDDVVDKKTQTTAPPAQLAALLGGDSPSKLFAAMGAAPAPDSTRMSRPMKSVEKKTAEKHASLTDFLSNHDDSDGMFAKIESKSKADDDDVALPRKSQGIRVGAFGEDERVDFSGRYVPSSIADDDTLFGGGSTPAKATDDATVVKASLQSLALEAEHDAFLASLTTHHDRSCTINPATISSSSAAKPSSTYVEVGALDDDLFPSSGSASQLHIDDSFNFDDYIKNNKADNSGSGLFD